MVEVCGLRGDRSWEQDVESDATDDQRRLDPTGSEGMDSWGGRIFEARNVRRTMDDETITRLRHPRS